MIDIIRETKNCSLCHCDKTLDNFSKRNDYSKYQGYCKECAAKKHSEYSKKNRFKLKEYNDKWFLNQGVKARKYQVKKDYNVDMDFIVAMYNSQNKKCAICGVDMDAHARSGIKKNFSKTFKIDHDHKTGKIRGLLCHYCNFGLGHFKDNISTIYKAIEYIKRNV